MKLFKVQFLTIFLVLCLCCSGVYAAWVYFEGVDDTEGGLSSSLKDFTHGTFYITNVEVVGGSYTSAQSSKIADTDIQADLTLNSSASSSVVLNVTFYNNSDVSYYYNEAQTLSSTNTAIEYTVSGIEQKEEVPAKSYKTITVTYEYKNGVNSNGTISSKVHFNFVVDKDSIGIIAAQNAVTRFREILNNISAPDSYDTLKTAMNNRGSNASVVSYIGNVAGASDSNSLLIQQLFTKEFLSMDLDGDGKAEPITLMIKRENLDNDTSTGDDYTYRQYWSDRTVYGADFTLYITSEGFDSRTLTVYAATFTKFEGSNEWVQVVPLTKGTATANNYNGWGTANSFNTDTWESEDGKTMDTLTQEAVAAMKK